MGMMVISLVFTNCMITPTIIYAPNFSYRSVTMESVIQYINDTDMTITLERNMCKGTCHYYSLIIFGSETVVYNGKEFVNVTEYRVSSMPQEEVGELVKAFYKANRFSIEGSHYKIMMTDQPTVNTSININGIYKNVFDNHGAIVHKELRLLANRIDEVANTTKSVQSPTFK